MGTVGEDDEPRAFGCPDCADRAGDSERRGRNWASGRGTCSLRRGGLTETVVSPFGEPPLPTPPSLNPFHGMFFFLLR